jgi:hypothetical protein
MRVGKQIYIVVFSVLLCLGAFSIQAQDLPEPWQSVDIGDVASAGSATFESDVFTVKGSGADIWLQDDAFHFAYQPAKGDCEISAYVTYVTFAASDAKACVMIRDTLTATSTFAMALTCAGPDHGTYFQWRAELYKDAEHLNLDHYKPAPMWVKLVRAGNTYTASMSEDGTTWDVSESTDIDIEEMGEDVYIGLGVCAHDGNSGTLCEVTFANVVVDPGDVTTIEEPSAFVSPDEYQLNQNYPNPFNPTTTISYNIPKANHVVLKVYDIQGKEITTLVNEQKSSGQHHISWDGKDNNSLNVTSGVYVYRLIAGDVVKSNKMILVK